MTIIADDIVAEYLFSEGSGTSVADEVTDGIPMSITGTATSWITDSYGTALRFTGAYHDSYARTDFITSTPLAVALSDATSYTYILVFKNLESSSNNKINAGMYREDDTLQDVGIRGHTLSSALYSAMAIGSKGDLVKLSTPSGVFTDHTVWIMSVDTTQATDTDRIRVYINGTEETSFNTTAYPPQNETLPTVNTATVGQRRRFGVGGTADSLHASTGDFYYTAVLNRPITPTEATEITTALQTDSDSSLVGGGGPVTPITVPKPTVSNIGATSATPANTVTADRAFKHYYGIWLQSNRPPIVNDDNRFAAIKAGTGAVAFRDGIDGVSGQEESFEFTNLLSDVGYIAFWVVEDALGNGYTVETGGNWFTTLPNTPTTDFLSLVATTSGANVLSAPTIVSTTENSFTVSVDSTVAGDTLYCNYRQDTPISLADEAFLKQGQSTTSVVGANQFTITGVDPTTEYFFGFLQFDDPVNSNVVSASVETASPPGSPPVVIEPYESIFAQVGDTINIDVALNFGGDTPQTFTATGLPTGLSISSAGAITGTASTVGVFNTQVTATNAEGSASDTFTFEITQPTITGLTLGAIDVEGAELNVSYSVNSDATAYCAVRYTPYDLTDPADILAIKNNTGNEFYATHTVTSFTHTFDIDGLDPATESFIALVIEPT
jgi:hypothetical protein